MVSVRSPFPSLAVALLLAAVFAGCLGDDGGSGADVANPAATAAAASDTAPTESDAPVENATAEPQPRTLYLGADGSLADTVPAAGQLVSTASYAKCLGAGECAYNELASAPLDAPYLIAAEPIAFTFFVATDGPLASSHVFDVGVWFGSTKGMPASVVTALPPASAPGTIKVEMTFQFDTVRPVLVPAGESFRMFVLVGGLPHEGVGTVKILTGGDSASAVAFVGSNVTAPPALATAASEETMQGALPLPSLFAGPAGGEGRTLAYHTVVVGPNATSLEIRLTSRALQPKADLDMDLFDGTARLSGSHTPLGAESMFLGGAALDGLQGKELTVRVNRFTGIQATYELAIVQT